MYYDVNTVIAISYGKLKRLYSTLVLYYKCINTLITEPGLHFAFAFDRFARFTNQLGP